MLGQQTIKKVRYFRSIVAAECDPRISTVAKNGFQDRFTKAGFLTRDQDVVAGALW